MTRKMPVSEVRKKLPALLKRLQKHPHETVSIMVHGNVMAELRSAPSSKPLIGAGAALLKALNRLEGRLGRPTESYPVGKSVAEDHDAYL